MTRLSVSVTASERATLARLAGDRAARTGERPALGAVVRELVRQAERERAVQGAAGPQPTAA